MRMCYLSISHTNVFSVTVPPGRLQEGSGALIKAAFAGQECGLLCLGVTEGWVFAPHSLCSRGQLARDRARGQWCLAVIRRFSLSLAFPLRPLAPPPLISTHSQEQHNTISCEYPSARAHTHTPSVSPLLFSSLSSSVLLLLPSFPSSVPWLLLGFPAA